MSLEEALNRNSDLLATQNDLLTKMLGAAAAKGGTVSTTTNADTGEGGDTGDGAGEKKKPGRPKKGETAATGGVSFDDLKKAILGWLGEFAKEEDKENPEGMHPEVAARKAALAKAYSSDKLKIEKLPEIKDNPEKLKILSDWFEKAKVVDKGFGAGRLVADPEPESSTGDDDGMEI